MKKRKLKRTATYFISVFALMSFGLWPLENADFSIREDQKKMSYKKTYLAKTVIEAQNDDPPNIIIILADDLSRQDISRYGGQNLQTPHIDAIGAAGITFTEAYAASPICAPSRAGLLTGRYPQRFGFEINIHERYPRNRLEHFIFSKIIDTGNWKLAPFNKKAIPTLAEIQKQGLPSSEFTLAEILKHQGYETAVIGKWHLGYNENSVPYNRGFDYHYGFYEAFSLYAPVNSKDIINQKLNDFSDPHIWKKGRSGTCAIRRNDEIIEEDNYLTHIFAEEAKDWITLHKDNPFFLYVPFSAPHTPFQVTEEYFNKYDHISSPEKRIYYAMIDALDDAVGEIMTHLKKLDLEENTIVFFMSDNGGAEYTMAADNSPLKGGKFSNFEGGINVPFMIQWKGVLPEGISYDMPVISLDIFATAAALAGVELPNDRIFDGVNLLPYFLTDSLTGQNPHETLYWRSKYHKAIRDGDWKLIYDELANRSVLYNLKEDKYEKLDRSKEMPELVNALFQKLANWEQQLIQPSWPRVMDYEIVEGQDTFYFPL